MTTATFRLMEALLECGPEGAHRESLLSLTQMSTATFYRGIEPLLRSGVLEDQRGHYTLPLSHPYNFAFKLWHGQSRLLGLPAELRDELGERIKKVQQELGGNLLALWLHGSVAQQTMHRQSDIDLLAVVRKTQEEPNLKGSRPIQLTCYSEKDFREAYREGDGFVRTVLAHGLLMVDHQFAQEFYSKPFPRPSPRDLKKREEFQQRIRSRLLFFVKEQALEDAQMALSSLAVATGRFMLEKLGELPAGKADLEEFLQVHFGSEFAGIVQKCLAKEAALDDIIGLQWQLSDWRDRFALNTVHANRLLSAFSGSAQNFESACCDIFAVLFPNGHCLIRPKLGDEEFDLAVQMADERLVAVECKSFKSRFTLEQLGSLPSARPLLVVVNQMREVPLTRRPALSPEIREEAQRLGIGLVDSRELWGFYNCFVLTRGGETNFVTSAEQFVMERVVKASPRARSKSRAARKNLQA